MVILHIYILNPYAKENSYYRCEFYSMYRIFLPLIYIHMEYSTPYWMSALLILKFWKHFEYKDSLFEVHKLQNDTLFLHWFWKCLKINVGMKVLFQESGIRLWETPLCILHTWIFQHLTILVHSSINHWQGFHLTHE